MAIKVRAIQVGFHGAYREVGDEFHIKEEKEFSKRWMEKVDDKAPKAKAESAKDSKSKGKESQDGDVL